MRLIAIGLLIALVVYIVSGGHFLFLPLLFVPFGLFGAGHRRRGGGQRRSGWLR